LHILVHSGGHPFWVLRCLIQQGKGRLLASWGHDSLASPSPAMNSDMGSTPDPNNTLVAWLSYCRLYSSAVTKVKLKRWRHIAYHGNLPGFSRSSEVEANPFLAKWPQADQPIGLSLCVLSIRQRLGLSKSWLTSLVV